MKKYILLVLVAIFVIGCSHQSIQPKKVMDDVDKAAFDIQQDSGDSQETVQEEAAEEGLTVSASIEGFAFNPTRLEVQKGTKVNWINKDSAPHTVTGDFGDSGALNTGDTYSYTFNDVGEFEYICTIHPSMKGIIAVKE